MCIIGPDEPTLPHAGSEYLPPGLTIINDFITAEEEELLLATLDWTNAESGQYFSCYLYSLECWWQFSIHYGNMEMWYFLWVWGFIIICCIAALNILFDECEWVKTECSVV